MRDVGWVRTPRSIGALLYWFVPVLAVTRMVIWALSMATVGPVAGPTWALLATSTAPEPYLALEVTGAVAMILVGLAAAVALRSTRSPSPRLVRAVRALAWFYLISSGCYVASVVAAIAVVSDSVGQMGFPLALFAVLNTPAVALAVALWHGTSRRQPARPGSFWKHPLLATAAAGQRVRWSTRPDR